MGVSDGRSLAGTTALITGGSRGIGREIAIQLAREGAAVAISARSVGELDHTLAELRQSHERVFVICANATDRAAVAGMVLKPRRSWGRSIS